jgi:8-oxo-dGTP pyrophosphatase MutT (NUDIX family)
MEDIGRFLGNIKLIVRAAVIIDTGKGIIFEKDPKTNYYFIIGGGIKIGESSEEAAVREIKEEIGIEIGIEIGNIKLKTIVERFFSEKNIKYHEFCFYYTYKLNKNIELPKNIYILDMDEIKNVDVKPEIILEIIKSKNKGISHLIINEIDKLSS